MGFTDTQLVAWIGQYFWPFVRITTLFLASPFFGSQTIVNTRIRLILSIAITLLVVPVLPPVPFIDPFSATGVLVTLQQILFGLGMGFLLQLAFTALLLGGNGISMPMGLGFANTIDPQNGLQVPVIGTFFMILGTLLFIAMDAHLVLIQVLVDSFVSMPISPVGMSGDNLLKIVLWGGRMFAGGLLIALPAMMIITLINIVFGVMTRAAPQLNIFSVGFPTTMAAGFLVMFLTIPNLLPRFTSIIQDAFNLMQNILTGG